MTDDGHLAPIRYVALLDVETTSLEPPPIGKTIEVAVALFDVKHAQIVASFASLIKGDSNEAEAVNGIPAAMLPEAREPERVWSAVRWIIEPASVVIAHNSDFDRQFTPDLDKPWICSESDIVWPYSTKGGRGGSLVHLALSLRLGVASAHRAMADVDTLARIFTRLAEKRFDIEAMIRHGMRPKAMVYSLAPYEERETVKANGFRWNPDQKIWWRRMAIDDTRELPFKVRILS
jgi:DNA polymerase III subunit epsilon